MSTQTERTESFIADIHQPRYVPTHEAQGRYAARVDALQEHARDLALRLDAVMELADAFLDDGMRDEFRNITSGEAELKPLKGNAEFHCFKESGKWYSSERGNLTEEVFDLYTTPDMREQILQDNEAKFPGLSTDGAGFVWLVVPDKTGPGYPLILYP